MINPVFNCERPCKNTEPITKTEFIVLTGGPGAGKTAAQIMSDVAFDSWVDISEKPEWLQEKLSDKCLKEQATFFPRLQKGISLLWAKEASLIWN